MNGGILLDEKKQAVLTSWTIRRPEPPPKVRIPMDPGQSTALRWVVQPGSRVRRGEMIAEPVHPDAAALHSSISGTVSAVSRFPHPLGEEQEAVEIVSDGRDDLSLGVGTERPGWLDLPPQTCLDIFRQMGLVEMDAAMVPLHVRAMEFARRRAGLLIVNACESEPYLTAEYALLMSHPLELLKGAEILRRFYGAEKVVFAAENHKQEPIEVLKSKIFFLKWNHFEVRILPSRYPQDEEVLLTEYFLGKNFYPQNKTAPAGAAVHRLSTLFAVYEAVVLQKPLYERAVTVGGECVVEPRNLWLRIGTSFHDAVRYCRGLMREPRKVLMGGPMKGVAQNSLEVPVVKGVSAVLALPNDVARPSEAEPCIRCGRCIDACPAALSPVEITLAAEQDHFESIREAEVETCFECGVCAYVCPAKRPMMDWIRHAKTHLQEPAEVMI